MFENCDGAWRDPKWYVLFVRSNQERTVACHLQSRDVEHYLPCYSSVRRWKDRRVTLEMPLFPGYVFVRMPLLDRLKAVTIPNVVSFVGSKDEPSAISDEEIDRVRIGLEHGNAQPCPYLKEGDRMAITNGVMAGMEGVLLRRQNGTRMIIALDSIGKAFVVEVDLASLKPVFGAGTGQRALVH
ncbi:MAG TPA: UpxY family transcription antiterminator [Terriglobales bacterium]|nr:UpxY family transcription antiterminator [Terriglobales bacterium]